MVINMEIEDPCKLCEEKLKDGASDALYYCYMCGLDNNHRKIIKENLRVDINNFGGK